MMKKKRLTPLFRTFFLFLFYLKTIINQKTCEKLNMTFMKSRQPGLEKKGRRSDMAGSMPLVSRSFGLRPAPAAARRLPQRPGKGNGELSASSQKAEFS
jgi:hypothetical protein